MSASYAVSPLDQEDVRVYRPRSGAADRVSFAELSVVRLLSEVSTFDGDPVAVGSVGTIVGVYGDGEAYDVEFSDLPAIAAVRWIDIGLA